MQLMQRVQELEEIEQMLRNQERLIKLWRLGFLSSITKPKT